RTLRQPSPVETTHPHRTERRFGLTINAITSGTRGQAPANGSPLPGPSAAPADGSPRYDSRWPNLLIRGRGTHPSGRSADRPRRRPTAEPVSSPRRPAGRFEVSVFRPTFSPTESQRAIGRNLALALGRGIVPVVTMALIPALPPTIARRGGLEPLGLSALAAAPFVANFLGAFAGRFGPPSRRELAAIRAAGAGALVLLVVAPLPAVMVIVSVLFWLGVSFAGPFQLRLWGSMYPSRLRGRVVGAIGMGRGGAGGRTALRRWLHRAR